MLQSPHLTPHSSLQDHWLWLGRCTPENFKQLYQFLSLTFKSNTSDQHWSPFWIKKNLVSEEVTSVCRRRTSRRECPGDGVASATLRQGNFRSCRKRSDKWGLSNAGRIGRNGDAGRADRKTLPLASCSCLLLRCRQPWGAATDGVHGNRAYSYSAATLRFYAGAVKASGHIVTMIIRMRMWRVNKLIYAHWMPERIKSSKLAAS